MAAHLVKGNSGSPIYFVERAPRKLRNQSTHPLLIGLQSSSFIEQDVAAFTDSQSIFEIIEKIAKPYNVDLRHGSTLFPQ